MYVAVLKGLTATVAAVPVWELCLPGGRALAKAPTRLRWLHSKHRLVLHRMDRQLQPLELGASPEPPALRLPWAVERPMVAAPAKVVRVVTRTAVKPREQSTQWVLSVVLPPSWAPASLKTVRQRHRSPAAAAAATAKAKAGAVVRFRVNLWLVKRQVGRHPRK